MKISAFASVLLLLSCSQNPKDKNPPLAPTEIVTGVKIESDIPHAHNSIEYLGIYTGKLPCENCPVIDASLELAEDFTFTLIRKKSPKSTEAIENKGTYSWNKDETAIVLDQVEGLPNEYLVGENTLTPVYNAEDPNAYILRKLTEAEAQKTDAIPTAIPKKK